MLNDLKESLFTLRYFDEVLYDLSTTFDGMVVKDLNENLLLDMCSAISTMRHSLNNLESAIIRVKHNAILT